MITLFLSAPEYSGNWHRHPTKFHTWNLNYLTQINIVLATLLVLKHRWKDCPETGIITG